MKKQKNPFKNLVINEYEQEIEDSIDVDRVKSVLSPALQKTMVVAAKKKLEEIRSKPITLRVKVKDLEKVKLKAKRQAIPYQTLLSSMIHQFAEDRIKLEWVG